MRGHANTATFFSGLQFPDFTNGHRNGFFDQRMFSRSQDLQCNGNVPRGGGQNMDRADTFVLEQLIQVFVDTAAKFFCDFFCLGGDGVKTPMSLAPGVAASARPCISATIPAPMKATPTAPSFVIVCHDISL